MPGISQLDLDLVFSSSVEVEVVAPYQPNDNQMTTGLCECWFHIVVWQCVKLLFILTTPDIIPVPSWMVSGKIDKILGQRLDGALWASSTLKRNFKMTFFEGGKTISFFRKVSELRNFNNVVEYDEFATRPPDVLCFS